MEAAWAGHISLLKLLIDNGAAVNTVTPTGISALHQGMLFPYLLLCGLRHNFHTLAL